MTTTINWRRRLVILCQREKPKNFHSCVTCERRRGAKFSLAVKKLDFYWRNFRLQWMNNYRTSSWDRLRRNSDQKVELWGDFYSLLLLSFFVNELDLWTNEFLLVNELSSDFHCGEELPLLNCCIKYFSVRRLYTLWNRLHAHFLPCVKNFLHPIVDFLARARRILPRHRQLQIANCAKVTAPNRVRAVKLRIT